MWPITPTRSATHLSDEGRCFLSGIVLDVGGDEPTTQFFHTDVLHVESNIVTWHSLYNTIQHTSTTVLLARERERVRAPTFESFVVHFDGLDFSLQARRSEVDDHVGLEQTGLDSTHGHCADTSDLVDILQRQTKGLVGRSLRWNDGIESFEQRLAVGIAFFALDGPSFVPWHLVGRFHHVVSVPARDGDKGNTLRKVADLLDVGRDFGLDFVESLLGVGWLGGVHLVDGHDHLFHTESEGEQSVFACLTVLGDPRFELTSTSSDDQHGTIGLREQRDEMEALQRWRKNEFAYL